MKVLVLGDEDTVALSSELPRRQVSRSTSAEISHVQRARKHVPQQPEQVFVQLLIEEQSHDSGRRNTLGPAFAFCGVGETGPNVFRLHLRKFLEELSLIFPSGQVPEDIAHGYPSPANARLPEPDRRIDADAIEKSGSSSLRKAFDAFGLLLVRFSISQMDVPTRQSYVMAVVDPHERSAASGITGVARTGGAALSPLLAGLLFARPSLIGVPFIIAGTLKIAYDLWPFRAFRAVKAPEEAVGVSL